MDTVITALSSGTSGLTPAMFFGTIADIVPFLVVIVPVAFGLVMLKKLIKGASKGKVRM